MLKLQTAMAPQMDLNVDWLQIRETQAKKVDSIKEYLKRQWDSNLYVQCQIEDVDLSNLNREQLFASNIIHQNMDSQTPIIIMGGTGTGKSTVVKAVTNIMNEIVQNIT